MGKLYKYIPQAGDTTFDELEGKIMELKDKLKRRNTQIKKFKTKLNWCREKLFQQGIRTDFGK